MWGSWGAKAAKGSLGLPYRTLQTAFSCGRSCLASRCPQSRFQTAVSTGCLWKAPGQGGQVIMPIHTELRNKDHVIEALQRAKFSSHQKISISRSGNLLSSMQKNLKTWWLKRGSSQETVGSNPSIIMAPWTQALSLPHSGPISKS